ncbi:MAG: nitroreductase [Verrucomicrobiota bacterium]
MQLRLALHYFGHAPRIELLPDPTQADFLARVHIGLHAETDSETVVLMQAIPTRHTNRQRFRDEAVPSVALAELQNAVEKEGAALQTIEDQETRWALANLVAEADRRQWADKPFRQELAAWVRPDQSPNNDGLSVASQDLGTLMSHAGPFMIRTFDLGKGHAAKDREIALYSPLLAVLITPQDDPAAWLTVGQALGRFLLRAEVEGLSTSFLNQPIEIPELRDQLRQTLSCSGMPQLLLRVGYSAPGRLTPRRPVREVLFTPPPQLREEELQ